MTRVLSKLFAGSKMASQGRTKTQAKAISWMQASVSSTRQQGKAENNITERSDSLACKRRKERKKKPLGSGPGIVFALKPEKRIMTCGCSSESPM
jgi:hypothetical protein